MSKRWRLKKGDQVLVITGSDKGKSGEVISIDKEKRRIKVGGIAMVTHFVKPTAESPGRLEKKERFISASNVMLIDPNSSLPTKVGIKFDGEVKQLVAKRSGAVIRTISSGKRG